MIRARNRHGGQNNIPTKSFKNVVPACKLRAMEATLNIPALFARFSEVDSRVIDELNLAALKKILSRAVVHETDVSDYDAWLYKAFTGQQLPTKQIPYASLTASLDGLAGDVGFWMRADPVYLYPDTHSLVLQDPGQLNLTVDERDDLADLIRPLLSDYGARLYTPAATRWYLQFENDPPELECSPLPEVLMKPVNNYLPTGRDSRRWHTLFNEIQMVLNRSPINEYREYYGQQPVNSLWFWGPGVSPESRDGGYGCCIGGDEYVQSLCRHTSSLHRSLHDGITVSRYQDSALLVEDRLLIAQRLNDPEQWLHSLQRIEHEVMMPLLAQLRRGNIRKLHIISDSDRRFECSSTGIKKFWKRALPVSSFLLMSDQSYESENTPARAT